MLMKICSGMLITINCLFMICALALIGLSSYYLAEANSNNEGLLFGDYFYVILSLMIALGLVVLCISTCGVFGARKGHKGFLTCYLIMMIICFLAVLGLSIFLVVLIGDLTSVLGQSWEKMCETGNYQSIAYFQKKFDCCGWSSSDECTVLVDCGSGGFCQNFVTKTIQEKISTEIFVLGGIMIFQFFSIVVSSILLCRSSSVYELVPDEEDTLDHFTINK